MLLCNVLLSAYRADVAPFVAAAPSEAVSCLVNQGAVRRGPTEGQNLRWEVLRRRRRRRKSSHSHLQMLKELLLYDDMKLKCA